MTEWPAIIAPFDYAIAIMLGLIAVLLIRPHLTYWPVLRLSFAIHIARSSFYGVGALLEWQGRDYEADQFRAPLYTLIVTTAVALVMLWCLVLIIKQNRADRTGTVAMSGTTKARKTSEGKSNA